MRRSTYAMIIGAALAVAGCQKSGGTQSATPAAGPVQQIAWREGDVAGAFAEAKESRKPVLLYWGAKWCPPCNLMKQTLFQDPAFIAQTSNFIPVHLDGDTRGAQLWGEKLGIAGYPTVIVLRPDFSEVTRLSGGGTAGALTDVLRIAATRTTSTEDLLKRAAAPANLSSDDWRMLASFDWLDDPKHFGDPAKSAAMLTTLAASAPDPAMRRGLMLTALTIGDGPGDVAKLTAAQQSEVAAILPQILASDAEVKANRQTLSYAAVPLIRALPDPAERSRLGTALIAALDRVAADDSVPLGDRLATVGADIALSKAGNDGKVTPAVLAKVRQRVALVDRAATSPAMRQAVIPDASDALDEAGDNAGATRLLTDALPNVVAPYYLMIDLSSLAEERKDNAAAIGWARKAAATAEGPATRIQWAIMYSGTVLRLAPADAAAIEASADMVIDALGQNSSGFAQRTAKKATAWGESMRKWSKAHNGQAVLDRLSARMRRACPAGNTGPGCGDVLTVA